MTNNADKNLNLLRINDFLKILHKTMENFCQNNAKKII